MSALTLRSAPAGDAHEDRHASNVVPLTTLRAILGVDALQRLLDVSTRLLVDERTWLLGDDRSAILAVRTDLALLVGIMTAGIRTDDAIATEATRLARILQHRFRRDEAGGLCASGCDPAHLLNSDAQ